MRACLAGLVVGALGFGGEDGTLSSLLLTLLVLGYPVELDLISNGDLGWSRFEVERGVGIAALGEAAVGADPRPDFESLETFEGLILIAAS